MKAAALAKRSAVRAQPLLAAGQKKTIRWTWMVRPSGHNAQPLDPGVYTIDAWDGGGLASATIQLKR